MLNQIIIVGRLTSITDSKNINKEYSIITVEIVNKEKSDTLIDVALFKNIYTRVKENCTVGDLVGIKGHLTNEDSKLILIADRMTFLSNQSNTD